MLTLNDNSMGFRLVDIQIQDANSGYLQTVFGGDFAEQGISRIVSDHAFTRIVGFVPLIASRRL
jgi:hypothetical protein